MPRIPAEFSRFGCAFLAHVGQERGAWLRRCPWDEQAPDDPEPQAPRRRTARQVSSWRPRVAAVYAGRRGLRWPRRAGWRFPVRLGRQLRAWSAERWLGHSCVRKEDREPGRALPACVARSVPFGWTRAVCGSRHPAGTPAGELPTRPRLWRNSWRRLGCVRSRIPAVSAGSLDLPAPLSGAGQSHYRRQSDSPWWPRERSTRRTGGRPAGCVRSPSLSVSLLRLVLLEQIFAGPGFQDCRETAFLSSSRRQGTLCTDEPPKA